METVDRRIGDLLEFVVDNRGKTPPLSETGFELIETASLVGENKFPNYGKVSKFVDEETFNKWFRKGHPRKGDILIATVGANIGNLSIMREGRGCVAQNLVALRVNSQVANADFLYYLLSSEYAQQLLKNLDIGAAQPSIKVPHLLNTVFAVPDVEEQRKIAAILSAYDDLIENNLRRIKILEEMAQNLYREWFVKFRFPGHENTRFVDSPLGRIPEGWNVATLGAVASVIPGYAFKSKDWADAGVPVIKIKNIQPGNVIDTEQVDHVPEEILSSKQKKYWLFGGEVLIAMTGATAGKVGKLRIKKPMLLNQRVAKIEPNQHFKDFVWCTMSSPGAEEKFYALADGAAQPNMSGGQIENFELLVPSIDLVQRFSYFVSPFVNDVDNMILRNKALRRTRDLLLPKLISGELDVSELDIHSLEGENNLAEPTLTLSRQVRPEEVESQSSGVRPKNSKTSKETPTRNAPTPLSEEADTDGNTPPPIDETDRSEVLQIIRQVFSDGELRDRETAIRDIARDLGYRRAGNRIQDIIHTDLLTASRRGILKSIGGELSLFARSIDEYERDFLKQQFLAAIGRTWIDREEAIREFCRWMGFARTGQLIEDSARSLINGLLREDRIESDNKNFIRRI